MPVRPERLFFSNANESTADPRGRGSPKRDSSKGIMKTVRDAMVFANRTERPMLRKALYRRISRRNALGRLWPTARRTRRDTYLRHAPAGADREADGCWRSAAFACSRGSGAGITTPMPTLHASMR